MKAFQRILAVLLCLVMSLGMISMVASADSIFDSDRDTGSLTIYKLEKDANTTDSTGKVTNIDATKLMGDVTFTIYQVMDETAFKNYLANADGSPEKLDAASYYDTNTSKPKYSVKADRGLTQHAAQTTPADGANKGKVTFSDLPLGVYLVVETDYPGEVTGPMVPFLVSIPMTDPENESNWLYDVVVYPKNSTATSSVTLIKKGEGENEADSTDDVYLPATFELWKETTETGDDVVDGYKKVQEVSVPDNATGAEITGLTHGNYKLIEKSVEGDDYVIDKTAITFNVDQNQGNKITYTSNTNQKVTAVSSEDGKQLTLTVTNEHLDVTKEDTSTDKTPGVGGTVTFEVGVEVPSNIKDFTQFDLEDAPTNLTVNLDSIVVKANDNTTLTKDTDYTVARRNDTDTDGYKIVFVPTNLDGYSSLTVTYSATVKAEAATQGKTKNDVTLTFHDSSKQQTDTASTDEQKYYKIDITKKLDKDEGGTLAANVEFVLYKDSALNQPVYVTNSDGTYVYDFDGTTDCTLITNSNGKIVVSGLPAGTYYLKETKAPDKYNLLKDAIEITVDANDDANNQTEVKTIVNKKGFELPQTGGIGTLMFIIIGGVLMAGGICLIVPNKKRAV